MSGKQNGMKRVFGVRHKDVPEPPRFTRPEGSNIPIEGTQLSGAGNAGHTMAPKRWEERHG